jgi:hypothetical protein
MSTLIRANMALVSDEDITKISLIDGRKVSTNADAYSKDNALGYNIICNTWLMMIREYSTYGWMSVAHYIGENGLLDAIKCASEAADAIVHEEEVPSRLFSGILRDIWSPMPKGVYSPVNSERNHGFDPMATALQVLRYPKRFSPLGADLVKKNSITDFVNTENRTKLLQRHEYSRFIIPWVRDEMKELVDWRNLCARIRYIISDPTDLTFTSGVGFDSRSSLGSKLKAISETYPEYFIAPFGYPIVSARYPISEDGSICKREEERYSNIASVLKPYQISFEAMHSERLVRVAAVPKSFKAARIIAVEDTARQAKARSIAEAISDYLPSNIPLRDQTVNQGLAREGSISHALCTVDLSHASDCISKALACEIFPNEFWELVSPYLGTHTLIDGRKRTMQQMSTAGNSLTFILECMVFMAISRAALNYEDLICGNDLSYRDARIPSVYGDDIVTYSQNYETLRDFLEALGFIVNETKSFWGSSNYRESCGEEYLSGTCVSSTYFPRFPIEGKIGKSEIRFNSGYHRDSYTGDEVDTLVSLVSLQQRLTYICFPAATYILQIIRDAQPKMTTSCFGSLAGDCWDYEDTSIKRYAPAAEWVEGPRVSPWTKPTRTLKRTTNKDVERYGKFLPSVRYTLVKEPSEAIKALYTCYKYQNFLKYGPRYDSELDRLLGVSSRPQTIKEVFGKPEIVWATRDWEMTK